MARTPQVGEDRQFGAEREEDVDLLGRVVDVVIATDHVADPHLDIVYRHHQVIGGR